jgi:hypothetical protein
MGKKEAIIPSFEFQGDLIVCPANMIHINASIVFAGKNNDH